MADLQSFNRAVAISVGGGDQTLAIPGKGVYISTSGTLVCRMRCGTSDTTFSSLPVGFHNIEIVAIRQTGTTAAGLVMYTE